MHGTSRRRAGSRAAVLASLAVLGSTMLATTTARAEPPNAVAPGPLATGFQPPGPTGPVADKPPEKLSLIKELPIASYVLTGVSAIVGAVVNVFGGNAANDLKDPSKHTTPDQTHSLVVRARSTVRVVLKISSAVKLPPVGVSAVPLPGGMAIGVGGRF
jgi:hypothetical protein